VHGLTDKGEGGGILKEQSPGDMFPMSFPLPELVSTELSKALFCWPKELTFTRYH
jgi:hypothetical protein